MFCLTDDPHFDDMCQCASALRPKNLWVDVYLIGEITSDRIAKLIVHNYQYHNTELFSQLFKFVIVCAERKKTGYYISNDPALLMTVIRAVGQLVIRILTEGNENKSPSQNSDRYSNAAITKAINSFFQLPHYFPALDGNAIRKVLEEIHWGVPVFSAVANAVPAVVEVIEISTAVTPPGIEELPAAQGQSTSLGQPLKQAARRTTGRIRRKPVQYSP